MTALINPFWFAAAGDPYYANVVLLCHFDGANGSSSLIDNSPVGRSPTSVTASQTTSNFKFGTASLSHIANSIAAWADSADWNFGAGQFTVEVWAYRTAAISAFHVLASQWPNAASNLGWTFRLSPTNLMFLYSTSGTDFPGPSGAYTAPLNTWVHLAADRDATNTLRVYADGVVIASAAAAVTFFNSTELLRVGSDATATRGFIGQLDDARITKGIARYGGAFTPATAPFPNS